MSAFSNGGWSSGRTSPYEAYKKRSSADGTSSQKAYMERSSTDRTSSYKVALAASPKVDGAK